MKQQEIHRFKAILEFRKSELTPQLRRREGIAIEKTPDVLDEVQLAAERELVTRTMERESNVLNQVRAALQRIEHGEFGTCLHCEREIGPKRLAAVPWTPLCISCQEQEDRKDGNQAEGLEWSLPRAA